MGKDSRKNFQQENIERIKEELHQILKDQSKASKNWMAMIVLRALDQALMEERINDEEWLYVFDHFKKQYNF